MLTAAIVLANLFTITPERYVTSYEDLVYEAQYNCDNAHPEDIDDNMLWDLVKIEKKYSVPDSLRGMVLAASCMESGHKSQAKGDYRIIKNKKLPMAIGILQQWPWYEKKYGIDRTNYVEAADSWMKHIVKKLHTVEKKCGFKTKTRKWIAAWVTAIRYPKPGGRCNERPKHYKLLRKWHRQIKKSHEEGEGC
tara:strand:- start:3089 stop:3667 length:579 start_codon:yes stop_codon:yes gene_type:complete